MLAWFVVGIVCAAGLAITTVALLSGAERPAPRVPPAPDWLVPTPVEMRARHFPRSWRGYDPVRVDVYLDAVITAYEALYVAARPEAIDQARERLADRRERTRGRRADEISGDQSSTD